MDLKILSTQLEQLPANGLTLKLKASGWLIAIYSLFFILLVLAIMQLPLLLWQSFLLLSVLIPISLREFKCINLYLVLISITKQPTN